MLLHEGDGEVEQGLLRDLRLVDAIPDRAAGLADDVEQGLVADADERAPEEAEQSAVVTRVADGLEGEEQVPDLAPLVEPLGEEGVGRDVPRR